MVDLNRHGLEFGVNMGPDTVFVYAVNVENEYMGFSLSEYGREGMRRISVEFRTVEELTKLRDALDAQIIRMTPKEPTPSPPDFPPL